MTKARSAGALSKSQRGTGTRLIGGPDAVLRADKDFYETPADAVKKFLDVEKFEGTILNPSCGRGAISKVLIKAGYKVHSSDLIDRGYGQGSVDFLTTKFPPFDNIVTNPPYDDGLAEKFLLRGLSLAKRKVCLLCRLLWLESKGRRELFETTPLARVWIYSGRVSIQRSARPRRSASFFGEEEINSGGGGGSMICFAWYVWEHGHKGKPTLGWL